MAKAVFTLTWNLVSPFGSFTLLRHALGDVSLICVFPFVRPTYPSFVEQNVVVCEAVMKTEEWKRTIFEVVYLNPLGHWMWNLEAVIIRNFPFINLKTECTCSSNKLLPELLQQSRWYSTDHDTMQGMEGHKNEDVVTFWTQNACIFSLRLALCSSFTCQ